MILPKLVVEIRCCGVEKNTNCHVCCGVCIV